MALAARRRTGSDEHYLIDICDRLFQRTACRQHRFPFLLGDRGKNGRQAKLPVDAYYPDLRLVVEVMERQHCESVPFFDKRHTVSSVSRGEQRRRYDELRQTILPQHGLQLIHLKIAAFALRGRMLRRDSAEDEKVVGLALADFLT
jgi:hypothetical protein